MGVFVWLSPKRETQTNPLTLHIDRITQQTENRTFDRQVMFHLDRQNRINLQALRSLSLEIVSATAPLLAQQCGGGTVL